MRRCSAQYPVRGYCGPKWKQAVLGVPRIGWLGVSAIDCPQMMKSLQRITAPLVRSIVRTRARGRSLEQLVNQLEASRVRLEQRFFAARDTAGNREALNHILGIERWSQGRLRVASGAPLVIDSYRGYRLPDGASLAELQAAFKDTRTETIALARALQAQDVSPSTTVKHNDLGDFSLVEWLVYLNDHANREQFRIRVAAS